MSKVEELKSDEDFKKLVEKYRDEVNILFMSKKMEEVILLIFLILWRLKNMKDYVINIMDYPG